MSPLALTVTFALVGFISAQAPPKQAPFFSWMGKKIYFNANPVYGNKAPTLNQICRQITMVSGPGGLSDGMGRAAQYMLENNVANVGDPSMNCLFSWSKRINDVSNTFGDYYDTVSEMVPFGYDACGPPSCNPAGIDSPLAVISQMATKMRMAHQRKMMGGMGGRGGGMTAGMGGSMGGSMGGGFGGGFGGNMGGNMGGGFGMDQGLMGGNMLQNMMMNNLMGGNQRNRGNPMMQQQPQASAFPVPQNNFAGQNTVAPKAAQAPIAPAAPVAPAAPAGPSNPNMSQAEMMQLIQNPQFMKMFMNFYQQAQAPKQPPQQPQQNMFGMGQQQQQQTNPLAANPLLSLFG